MVVKEKRNSWLQKYASTSRSARTFCRVFVLLSANGLVNDHNLGDTVCIPLIGLSVTFNPLRMPLSTLPSLGSRGCHFQPRCHAGAGWVWNIYICKTKGRGYVFPLTCYALLVIGEVSKVVMEYVWSPMSGNPVLRISVKEWWEDLSASAITSNSFSTSCSNIHSSPLL